MKLFPLSLLNAAILCAGAPALADQTSPIHGIRDKTPQLVAFTGATVHTEPGKTLQNATVLISNGKITAVGTGLAVPNGYRTIDSKGHHIYAGFIDLYSNYGVDAPKEGGSNSYRDEPVYQNERQGGNASNAAIHAEQQWVNTFKPDEEAAKNLTTQGFTVVQSARMDGIFRGQAVVASLGNGLPGELILKADASHFMSFDKGSSVQSYPSSLMGSIALVRQTLADANWYKSAYGKTDWRFFGQAIEFNAALAALGKLNDTGLVFEVDSERSLLRADSLVKEFNLAKASYVASGFEYARVAEVKNTGRPLIVPVAYPKAPAVAKMDDQLDVSLADLRHWDRAPSNLAALTKAGVPVALTTYKLEKTEQFWPNVRLAVKYGLSESAALAALTTTPAEMLGMPGQLGRIANGYQADIVIANGDLFKDGEIVATWTRGQEHAFKPINDPDFTGEYALDLAGEKLQLQISKADGALEAKLVAGDKNVKVDSFNIDNQQLQFSAALNEVSKTKGVAQFSGVLSGQQLFGDVRMPNGQQLKITASRKAMPAAADEKKDVTPKLVSKLTFPNLPFGYEKPVQQKNVHIKNATVWTSDKAGKLENTDVIVADGEFKEIGKDLSTPSGYEVIDATGMHLTAGLIDEHSHIAIEMGVNEGSDAVTSEVNIGDVISPDDINIYRGLAGGTTTSQLLHGSANPIGGQAQIIQLRWGVSPDGLKFKNAPKSIKFALGENVKQSNWGEAFTSRYPQSRVGVETVIRDAFQAAKEYKASWEAYDDLSSSEQKRVAPPRVDYRLQTLVEILDKKRFIHTHSYVASEILMLIHLADEMGFKVTTFTHILEGYKVADEMKAHGASASTFADWWAYKMEVQDAIPTNACIMASRGLVVSVNSDDAGLQRLLNQEAAKSVAYCGMSEEDALKMVTLNPAIQLKIDDKVGSVVEGKQADFVLWSGHPLSVYSKSVQTWIEGIPYYDAKRDLVAQQQIGVERQLLIQKVLGATDEEKAGSGGGYKKPDPLWQCETDGDVFKNRLNLQHQH